eukprot:scaffold284626_cov17-Tisochrysis_lutea.AAC.1
MFSCCSGTLQPCQTPSAQPCPASCLSCAVFTPQGQTIFLHHYNASTACVKVHQLIVLQDTVILMLFDCRASPVRNQNKGLKEVEPPLQRRVTETCTPTASVLHYLPGVAFEQEAGLVAAGGGWEAPQGGHARRCMEGKRQGSKGGSWSRH